MEGLIGRERAQGERRHRLCQAGHRRHADRGKGLKRSLDRRRSKDICHFEAGLSRFLDCGLCECLDLRLDLVELSAGKLRRVLDRRPELIGIRYQLELRLGELLDQKIGCVPRQRLGVADALFK
jgi:hypothetical protein